MLCAYLCFALVAPAFAQSPVRPSASGAFTDKNGTLHSWVIGPTHTLMWDGVPFIPAGVVFESKYLCEAPTEENWRADTAILDAARDRGISDLVVRPSAPMTLCPREAWQRLVNYLEEKGFAYGIEVKDGPRERQKFFIVRPALYRESDIKAPMQRTYVIPGTASAIYCLVDSRTGGAVEHGYARVSSDGRTEVNLQKEALGPGQAATLLLYPTKEYRAGEAGYPDLWSGFGEYRDRLLKFCEGLTFGPGLRFFLNPLGAGISFSGEFATAIPDSPEFRTEFEAWLSQRYANPAAVCAAWGLPSGAADSLQQLARLLPLWSEGRGVGSAYDRAADSLYNADVQSSRMWNDIVEFRDSSMQFYLNTIAALLKKFVADVPVVVRCSSHTRIFANGATRGFDGLAADSVELAGAAYSLCEESAETTWLTAVGAAADPAQASNALDALRSLGVKAFYPFVLSAGGGADVSQSAAALRKLSGELAASGTADYSPSVLYYPTQPPVGAVMTQLPDGAWWLPTLRLGAAVAFGDSVLGYVLGPDLYVWSDSGPTRLTFKQQPASSRGGATLMYPSDPKTRKSVMEVKKDRLTVSISETPVALRGLDPLQVVPLEAAKSEIDRLAAYSNYAEQAGVEVASYKLAVKNARKMLSGGRPLAALDMAQANLQRLCAVFNPYLWFEGETAAAHNFDGVKSFRGASGGLCLAIDNPDDPPMSPYTIAFSFDVPRDGRFDIWLAGSAPGRDGASPASFSIDGSDWREIGPTSSDAYAPGLYWQDLGTISFAGGKHTFTLRLNGKGDGGYRFTLDALLFASAPFTPKGAAKPIPPARYIPGGK